MPPKRKAPPPPKTTSPPKRQAPPPPPPPKEADLSGSGSEESESEEEAVPLVFSPNKTQTPKPNPTSNNNNNGNADEEEEEEESDSESEPDVQTDRPATQPNPPPHIPRPESESLAPAPAPRAAIGNPKPNLKPTTTQQPKKSRFARLWSPADELAILRVLADYRAKHGKLPTSEESTRLICKVVSVDCDGKQLYEKIRRLKERYGNAVKKYGDKDGVRDFKTPHDRELYELSAKVWGNVGAKEARPVVSENTTRHTDFDVSDGEESFGRVNGRTVSTRMRPTVVPVCAGIEGLAQAYPLLAEQVEELEKAHPCGKLLKRAFLTIDGGKASALDAKIKRHRMNEVKMHMRGADLTKDVVKALLDLVK